MANSMTGFGRATASVDGRELTVELKSVNHRYLDLGFRMPRHISFIEDVIRAKMPEYLSRGHVDVYVNYRNTRSDARKIEVDKALLGAYIESAKDIKATYGLHDDMTLMSAMRLPDVTTIIEADEDRDAVCELAREALAGAIEQLKTARRSEGMRLCADLEGRVSTVKAIAAQIAERAPLVVEEYRIKLNERIAALLDNADVDPQRIAMEVAVFADKASIDEELVRLGSHTVQMLELLASEEPVGRRLDFVVQEMNREFNTIGSKANDAKITQLVILGKAEIEKIREQVQNIE